MIFTISDKYFYLLVIKHFVRRENSDVIKLKTRINEQLSNNEGLGAYYYITRPRLRIGTVME